ncbi:MAG: glycerophosphodiester phosphodiesterase family protein [Alistipes sp.]|nr:glycerophosphodiester phosphodiesterase family protein [Alistipes sp.]
MRRFFTLVLSVLALLPLSAQSRAEKILREIRNPKSDYVVVIAHRSDWRHHPENSLAAMDSAIAMGVDMVEIDVQRTADGVLICNHDATLDRTTTGKGKIKEINYEQIKPLFLRTKSGVTEHRIPTLAEALDLCKDRVLINIDKGYNYYDQILEMLLERDMVEQVVIKGSKKPATVAKQFAKHKSNMLYMPIINYTSKKWEKHAPLFDAYLSSDIPTIAYEICWDGTLKGERKIFNRVLNSGAKLWVNTLWGSICGGDKRGFTDNRAIGNEAKVYGKLLSFGVTMIQTDRPQQLLNYLQSVGRHTLE